jgi:curli biogenesis system outer membrane secretion channel CsgG
MRQRKLIGLVLVGLVRVTIATAAMAQEASARPAVAIADVAIASGGWTLPPAQLSSTIIEMMMNELVSTERFRVYDGQWLVPEAEAGRPNLDRLRHAATERHVDYVVLGSLTAFSTENKKKRVGAVVPLPFLLGRVVKQQAQLRVAMTFRIVDVRTGEIVATATGEGLGIRRATGVAAGGIVGPGLPIGALAGARLPAARDAMLDEAVQSAVHNAALALADASVTLESRIPR